MVFTPGLGGRDLAAERAARRAGQQKLIPQGTPRVQIDQLMPSPENGRKKLHKVEELAETIRTDGMNTAMTVLPPALFIERYPQHKEAVDRAVAGGVLYVVHHGHRRLAAARLAGLRDVPVLVRDDKVPSLRIAAIQENLQRMGLNPVEEGEEFADALAEVTESGRPMSQRELAQRVGCSQTYVSHRIALLRLVAPLQEAVVNHWLKEQGVEAEGLLLPVREAATVCSRLTPDLQLAFAQGSLSSEEAGRVCKLPAAEQQPALHRAVVGEVVASAGANREVGSGGSDCAAITSTDAEDTSGLPHQREDRPATTPQAPPAGPVVRTSAAGTGEAAGTADPVEAVPSRTTTVAAPSRLVEVERGGDMEQLAIELIDVLSEEDLAVLRRLLPA